MNKYLCISFLSMIVLSSCSENTTRQNWFFGNWKNVDDSQRTIMITEDNICIDNSYYSWVYTDENNLYIGTLENGQEWEYEIGISLWEDDNEISTPFGIYKRVGRKPQKPTNDIRYSNVQNNTCIYGTWRNKETGRRIIIDKENTYFCDEEIEVNSNIKGESLILNIDDNAMCYFIDREGMIITDSDGASFLKYSDSTHRPMTREQRIKLLLEGATLSRIQFDSGINYRHSLYFGANGVGTMTLSDFTTMGWRTIRKDNFRWGIVLGDIKIIYNDGDYDLFKYNGVYLTDSQGNRYTQ